MGTQEHRMHAKEIRMLRISGVFWKDKNRNGYMAPEQLGGGYQGQNEGKPTMVVQLYLMWQGEKDLVRVIQELRIEGRWRQKSTQIDLEESGETRYVRVRDRWDLERLPYGDRTSAIGKKKVGVVVVSWRGKWTGKRNPLRTYHIFFCQTHNLQSNCYKHITFYFKWSEQPVLKDHYASTTYANSKILWGVFFWLSIF